MIDFAKEGFLCKVGRMYIEEGERYNDPSWKSKGLRMLAQGLICQNPHREKYPINDLFRVKRTGVERG